MKHTANVRVETLETAGTAPNVRYTFRTAESPITVGPEELEKTLRIWKTLGRPRAMVSNYERGQRRIDVGEFIEIACLPGLDPAVVVRQLARDNGARSKRAARRRGS